MDRHDMPNWDDMRFLLSLSRHKSTLKTAQILNVSHQTVSRRLNTLEQTMQARLLDRSTTPWQLTHMGQKLVEQAENIEKCMNRAEQITRSEHHDMSGRVHITSVDLGLEFIILPCIKHMLDKYPKLQFDINSNLKTDNISSGEFDLALRFTNAPPPDLIGRKIGTVEFAFYGTPDLIRSFDTAITNSQTISVPLINLLPPHGQSRNLDKKHVSSDTQIHHVSDLPTMMSAVKLGLGVGLLPKTIANKHISIEESSHPQTDKNLDAWILRNQDSRNSEKFKKIEAHLIEYASTLF